jgi:hypothetical protein
MRGSLLALALLACALVMGVSTASAATTTVKVTPNNQPVLWPSTDTRPGGSFDFVTGPATPPLGSGSLHLVTTTSTAKVQLGNSDYAGTSLSAIDQMSYSTYRSSSSTGSAVQAPSYQLPTNTSAGFTTLVFEPVYNTDQGAIVNDTWQSWDALNGGNGVWWSTRDIPGVCASNCFVKWSDIVAANPTATIQGELINQGSGNPGIDANLDAYTFGANGNATTWNFDPLTGPPTSKDQCKDGGWQSFDNPTFKNQGDCVSYVATKGKNK